MYQEYEPNGVLSAFIDKYWEFKGTPTYGMCFKILPDGCTDFIFSLGDVAQPIHERSAMQPYKSYFVGPMKVYSELVTVTKTVHMMGISPKG